MMLGKLYQKGYSIGHRYHTSEQVRKCTHSVTIREPSRSYASQKLHDLYKSLWNTMRVSFVSATVFPYTRIFRYDKYLASYVPRCEVHVVVMYCPLLLSVLKRKTGTCQQILVEINIKFHKNPPSSSRAVTYRETNKHGKITGALLQLLVANAPRRLTFRCFIPSIHFFIDALEENFAKTVTTAQKSLVYSTFIVYW
jgi:hypothetical protein